MTDFQLQDPWKDGDLLRDTQDQLLAARSKLSKVESKHRSAQDFAHTLVIENERLWAALESADPLAARNLREALA